MQPKTFQSTSSITILIQNQFIILGVICYFCLCGTCIYIYIHTFINLLNIIRVSFMRFFLYLFIHFYELNYKYRHR